MVSIYTLTDPRTGIIRYIGQTSKPVGRRLRGHLTEVRNWKRKRSTHKVNWIRSIMNDGLEPIIEVMDLVSFDEADFWEIFYYDLLCSWGFDLVNDPNYLGIFGKRMNRPITRSKEASDKQSKTMKDKCRCGYKMWNAGTKGMKLTDGPWKGKNLSAEHKAKISKSGKGRKMSDEHRRKLGDAMKRRWAVGNPTKK